MIPSFKRLLLLLLLVLPAVVQAQFTFMTNNGATTITGYTASGGAVTIPSTINGGGVSPHPAMQNITLIAAIAGFVFGFVGIILGLVNTWQASSHDRIKIRVAPGWIFTQHKTEGMGIEITNLSYMAVTITQVGFTVPSRDGHIPVSGELLPGGQLPQRMEPRTQITAFVEPATYQDPVFAGVHKAYADTACGKRFTGTSKALRFQIRRMASARHQK
jgi:hypothetical protein